MNINIDQKLLPKLCQMMGDSGRNISYLKVDIEGAELTAIPEWIKSGILDSVTQIGIEIHSGKYTLGSDPTKLAKDFSNILTFIRDLHSLGFKLISFTNNDCVAKSDDVDLKFFSLMEVVFYKDD